MTAQVKVGGVPVSLLFPCREIRHSTAWEDDKVSGDRIASVQVTCDPNFQPQWTLPGQTFQVWSHNGGLGWGGLTVEPERNAAGLTLHAQGIGVKLGQWPAIYLDPVRTVLVPTFVPNDAVDYATSHGAPFSRYGVNLGTTAIARPEDGGMVDLGTLLVRAATMQGKRVWVDSYGAITFVADPTTPKWTTTPDELYMGTADEQLVTRLTGNYVISGESQFMVRCPAATGGTFTLYGNGGPTAAIAYNATTGTVQTAVRALGGMFDDATVQGSAGNWLVIVNAAGALLTGDGTSLTPGAGKLEVSVNAASRVTAVEDAAAAEKFGDSLRSMDLTGLGPLTSTEASTFLQGRLDLVGSRMGWTEKVELSSLNLMHITGAWARADGPKAGDMLQIPGNMDARSNPTIRAAIQFVLSEVEVLEADDPTAVAAPLGFTPRDFEGALAKPENPTNQEAA